MKLPQVTLVCVEGTDKEENITDAIHALEVSSKNIEFNKIVLISPNLPVEFTNNIIYKKVEKMTWLEYNHFMVHKLNSCIDTEFCITIQNDGFILNSDLWTDDFLNYDFIGHAWDFVKCPFQVAGVSPSIVELKGISGLNRVGNGGFSLRSKKLLEISASIPIQCNGPEDVFICNDNYDYFIKNGIKYAPVEIADKFSKDYSQCKNDTFGFHGNKDIIKQIRI